VVKSDSGRLIDMNLPGLPLAADRPPEISRPTSGFPASLWYCPTHADHGPQGRRRRRRDATPPGWHAVRRRNLRTPRTTGCALLVLYLTKGKVGYARTDALGIYHHTRPGVLDADPSVGTLPIDYWVGRACDRRHLMALATGHLRAALSALGC
jgi:hypothetical protein